MTSKRTLIDLSGQTFGRLKVIERVIKDEKRGFWLCECACGNRTIVKGVNLINGHTLSCGCYQKDKTSQIFLIDLSGKQYGKLKVLYRDESRKEKSVYWICQCECGQIVSVRGSNLKNGTTKSCGCLLSKGEYKIREILSSKEIIYQQQYSFSELKGKERLLRFDFAIFNKNKDLKGLIEFQGQQHYFPIEHFGGEAKFEENQYYDSLKRDYCRQKSIPLLEISYNTLSIEQEINSFLKSTEA